MPTRISPRSHVTLTSPNARLFCLISAVAPALVGASCATSSAKKPLITNASNTPISAEPQNAESAVALSSSAPPITQPPPPSSQWLQTTKAILQAHGNSSARPVRPITPGQPPTLTYQSTRGGSPKWYSASSVDPDAVPTSAAPPGSCATPWIIAAGATSGTVAIESESSITITRKKNQKRITLSQGDFAGEACWVAPNTSDAELWFTRSSPLVPPEIFALNLSSRKVRPLRSDAHPTIAHLSPSLEFRSERLMPTEGACSAVELVGRADKNQGPNSPPVTQPRVVLWSTIAPTATWDPLARLLAETGARVVVLGTNSNDDKSALECLNAWQQKSANAASNVVFVYPKSSQVVHTLCDTHKATCISVQHRTPNDNDVLSQQALIDEWASVCDRIISLNK